MVDVGERWKSVNAQTDFTIVRLDDEYAYYKMNWTEHQRHIWLTCPFPEFEFGENGRVGLAAWKYHDPDQICMARLSAFEDGQIVRSE